MTAQQRYNCGNRGAVSQGTEMRRGGDWVVLVVIERDRQAGEQKGGTLGQPLAGFVSCFSALSQKCEPAKAGFKSKLAVSQKC